MGEEFNRQVNRGEGGIRILAPAPYTIKKEQDKVDPVTREIMLDRDGMPEKEEIQIRIPAFRVVRMFDVSQTDGEPLPELEVKELLSTVEGYEDFIKAVSFVAPVPVSFEDIPSDPMGFFSHTEKRIAVQEGMSESQTLKTLVHETTHAMLHDKDVNKNTSEPTKDRNTREVEAESVAYTVCKHFGIDTSEYSFGYIAGWSSGKGMKELKSSLDTIRRTASELITGIEAQLLELERDRELMQEQAKEFILAVSNTERSHFDITSVKGMEKPEMFDCLLAMNDEDRENVEAYLESRGAWVTHLGDDKSEEVEEFHVDYIYNTDTHEITDVKYAMEMDRQANEPIKDSDVVLKIMYKETDGYEIDKITNMTREQALDLAYKLAALDENEWDGNIQDFMEENGAEYVPIIVKDGRNSGMPEFFDIAVDLKAKGVSLEKELSGIEYAASIVHRLEHGRDVFSPDERNLIVNYGYKLDDYGKTKELAETLAYRLENEPANAALTVIDAQAEIDALPDGMIGLSEMHEYGYTWEEMLPLTKETALELFDRDLPVYQLHEDGTETMAEEREQITRHEGIFGIEKADWEIEKSMQALQEELAESRANKEAQLLYGNTDKYGIYQLKDDPELRHLHFEGTESLKKMGIIKDNLDVVKPENYNLIYTGELSGLSEEYGFLPTREDKLETIYEKLNINRPADFKGHSLSVSDVIVLHINGKNSAYFVDSFGFTGLPNFLEQEKELSAGQEKLTSGHDVQKSKQEPTQSEQSEPEQSETAQPEPEQSEPQAEQNEQEQPSETPDVDMGEDDGDEIIDLGDETDQVLAEMKKSLKGEQETELAFQIADRFISIQETEGGYDYSIMDIDYKEIDGGVYDNPDASIREALNDMVEDLKENPFDNGVRGNIRNNDELIFVDYEKLMERVEEADSIEPQAQEDVVANFRKKTNELFHKIGKSNPAEIEETVKCFVQAQIDEAGIDAKIVDAVVAGSRCRGLERESADLDVAVELSTDEREDTLFDMFNEAGLHIGGVKVDINSITAQRTGTLETYLPQVEEYLAGVREARENELVSIFNIRMNDEERWFNNTNGLDAEGLCKAYAECDKPFVEMGKYGERIEAADHAYIEQGGRLDFSIEFNEETDQITIFDGDNFEYKGLRETLFPVQAEPEVTLTVAECGEFHNLGEFYENIPTVEEAVAIWKQIPLERMNGIPAIGIHIHTLGTEAFEDVGMDILSGNRIDLDILEYIPDIKGNPQAMEMIAELVAKLPEMEIDGNMSEEMEAKVWEKRMPDLTPAEQLAVEIDRFIYGYDTALYHDNNQSMTENVSEIAEGLKQRDARDMAMWFADIAADGTEPEERKRAMEFLGKLVEYKPLAKIEEMEEQNYNMVDNVLNNGAGEKAQKEENKKAQDRPAAKPSLKARLAEKKAQVAGQGRAGSRKKIIKINRGGCKDMDIMFTVEESNLICIFAGESRNEVIKDIERALPYLEDTDMAELSGRVIGKPRGMTDEEFAQLELTEAE